MKKHQFEEITFVLHLIATLLAYQNNIMWLFYILSVKTSIDLYCSIYLAYKSAKKAKLKKQNEKEILDCSR